MSEVEIIGTLTQFGAAGLVAWMWLSERRAAAERERQLLDAHQRVMEHRVPLDALMEAVRDNTRAMTAVEAGQRSLVSAINRMPGVRGESLDRDEDQPSVRRVG